jgi:RNA polymerase-associated protein CTR9
MAKALIAGSKDKYLEDARRCFNNAITVNATCLQATLGLGCVHYHWGLWQAAREYFAAALRNHPNGGSASRFGLGLCFYQMGVMDNALACFKRVLQLEPGHLDAMVATAVLERAMMRNNKEADVHAKQKNREDMVKAFQASQVKQRPAGSMFSTSGTLFNQMAQDLFEGGDIAKSLKFGLSAFHSSALNDVKAESVFIMARAYHVQGDYNQAYTYYLRATKQAPDFILPYFCLGQLYMHRGQPREAEQCFERVLAADKDCKDALSWMGRLMAAAKPPRTAAAIENFRRVTEIAPDDWEARIELAAQVQLVHDAKHHALALASYEKALRLMQRAGVPVPYELWNNVGALRLLRALAQDAAPGRLEKADDAFEHAMRAAPSRTSVPSAETGASVQDARFIAENVTVTYNVARLREAQGRTDLAEELYRAIVAAFPTYVDCHLRLAIIAQGRGRPADALAALNAARESDESASDAWAMLGTSEMMASRWSVAQKHFEKVLVLSPATKHDAYAEIALGNIYFACLYEDDSSKFQQNLTRSETLFHNALLRSPLNMYAANGLGMAFAARGRLHDAREVFTTLRESAVDMGEAWINLAHIYALQEQPLAAAKMYEMKIKKFEGSCRDTETMMYMAKALFDAQRFDAAVRVLSKITRLAPADHRAWYNLALTLEESAMFVMGKHEKGLHRTYAETARAVADLRQAHRVFERLAAVGAAARARHQQCSFSVEKAGQLALHCARQIGDLEKHREWEEKKEKKKRAQREEQIQRLAEREREKREEAAAEAEKKKGELSQLDDMAWKLKAEQMRLQDEAARRLAEEEAAKKLRKKPGGRKKEAANADDALSDSGGSESSSSSDAGSEAGGRRMAGDSDSGVSDLFGSDSDDDLGARGASLPRAVPLPGSAASAAAGEDSDEEMFGDDAPPAAALASGGGAGSAKRLGKRAGLAADGGADDDGDLFFDDNDDDASAANDEPGGAAAAAGGVGARVPDGDAAVRAASEDSPAGALSDGEGAGDDTLASAPKKRRVIADEDDE